MKEFRYTVVSELGMHARPAGMFAKLAKSYRSKIMIYKEDRSSDALRLMNVMRIGIRQGDQIRITVDGEDEEQALAGVEQTCREYL